MKKVSFVIPCYCSAQTISFVVQEINRTISMRDKYLHEIILVNDASPDSTFEEIKKLCVRDPNIIGLDLARNFGQHSALMAGMNIASGDIIVCMDDDGQTPADEVWSLIDKIEEGYDVVYARYAQKKHSLFRNYGSHINSLMTEKLLNKPKSLYISSYFASRRFVVDEIIKYKNAYPYVIGLVLRTTNKICNVNVHHRERLLGSSGYSMRKLLVLWFNGFTAFSVKPLRIATYGGILTALLGFLYAIYTIINKICNPNVPLGWSSTMSVILLIGGVMLVVMGMMGEYIGRTYLCINNAPQFVIREVLNCESISIHNSFSERHPPEQI